MTSKPNKPAKKHHVPVDGTAVNTGWTIENARYARRYGRNKIAAERGEQVNKRIQQEVKDGKRQPVKVRVDF